MSADRKKILIFCKSSTGIGHFMRSLKIYKSLSRDFSVLLVLQWEYIKKHLTEVSYILAPENFSDHWSDNLINKKFFNNFIPDIFLVDFYPLSKLELKNEVDFFIRITKNNWWKVYSFMRDIYDWVPLKINSIVEDGIKFNLKTTVFSNTLLQSYKNWSEKILWKILLEKYINDWLIDWLIIFWDEKYISINDEYDFSRNTKEKIAYMGYILDDSQIVLTSKNKYTYKVMVSTWWAFFNKEKVLKILRILSNFLHLKVYFFPWNNLWEVEVQSIERYVNTLKNIEVCSFENKFYELLNEADILFNAWWYNTYCDILKFKIHGIIFGYDSSKKKYLTNYLQTKNRLVALEKTWSIHWLWILSVDSISKILKEFYSRSKTTSLYQNINTWWYDSILKFIKKSYDNNQ